MGGDDDYTSFLDKANQPLTSSKPATGSQSVSTQAVNADVPAALQQVREFYISDADELFEPVSLKWEQAGKAFPSGDDLKALLQTSADVAALEQKDFDPQGQYDTVIIAVKKAGSGKVGFFRVELGGTRAEYYVVSVDEQGGKIVGLKAKAVES